MKEGHNTARGPRPGTWYKQQRAARAKSWLAACSYEYHGPPPIYTRPEPRKQGVKGKQ